MSTTLNNIILKGNESCFGQSFLFNLGSTTFSGIWLLRRILHTENLVVNNTGQRHTLTNSEPFFNNRFFSIYSTFGGVLMWQRPCIYIHVSVFMNKLYIIGWLAHSLSLLKMCTILSLLVIIMGLLLKKSH